MEFAILARSSSVDVTVGGTGGTGFARSARRATSSASRCNIRSIICAGLRVGSDPGFAGLIGVSLDIVLFLFVYCVFEVPVIDRNTATFCTLPYRHASQSLCVNVG